MSNKQAKADAWSCRKLTQQIKRLRSRSETQRNPLIQAMADTRLHVGSHQESQTVHAAKMEPGSVCLPTFFGRCALCAVPRTIFGAMMLRMKLSLLIRKVAPPNLRSLHSRVWIPPQKGPRRFQLVVAWLQRQLLLLRCHPLLRRQCFQLLAPLKVRLWRPLLRPGSQRRIVQPLLVRGWKIPNIQLAMTRSPTPHFPTLSWEVGKIWKYLEGSL